MATVDTTGMTWTSVRRIQCGLNARGAHLVVDGKWGPSTDAALTTFVDRSFDYGYSAPADGAAVVRVTSALSSALRCPTEPTATAEVPPSSSTGWWVAAGLAAAGAALLAWGWRRA